MSEDLSQATEPLQGEVVQETPVTPLAEAAPQPAPLIAGLAVGRIVHYVLESERSVGEHRPAIVVRDWKQPNGLVQLQVFVDGLNDGFFDQNGISQNVIWRTSVHYSESNESGTWHWPERA